MSTPRAFVPGIGFRGAGMRLERPISVTRGDRTLTVQQLVATPQATDLIYDVTWRPQDQSPQPPGSIDKVTLYDGEREYGVGGGMHLSVREGRIVRGFTMVPLPPGLNFVQLRVSVPSIDDWSIGLPLVPFPAGGEGTYETIGASATRHGITVTLRGMVATRGMTAFDLIALVDRPAVRVHGLGGLGMRDASTALRLSDQTGRTYEERSRQDARDQFPDPSGIADVAVFDPLPDDADELSLDVPSVCFDDPEPTVEIALPIQAPLSVMLGPYPIRLLASRPVEVRRGPGAPAPAVAIDLDLGSVNSDLCVIRPWQAKVDGRPCGLGFGGHGIYGPSPQPLKTIEVFYSGPEPPSAVTLVGASVRAGGAWRLRFRRESRRMSAK